MSSNLVNMAPAEAWGDTFLYGVETYKAGRSMFVAHYATRNRPGSLSTGGSLAVVAAGIAQTDERQLRVAEDFNRGVVAGDDPVLLILTPSLEDSSRVPEGKHTMKIINVQPYSLREGHEKVDEIKERVAANNLEHLRRYAPNLTNDRFSPLRSAVRLISSAIIVTTGMETAMAVTRMPPRQKRCGRPGLRSASHADSRPLSNWRYDSPRRFSHRGTGPQCRNGAAQGPWSGFERGDLGIAYNSIVLGLRKLRVLCRHRRWIHRKKVSPLPLEQVGQRLSIGTKLFSGNWTGP